MSQLAQFIWKACSASGLHADLGFRLELPSGKELITVARITELGAPNGMLVFSSNPGILAHSEALSDAGYGYSVLSEPRPDEEFDLESFRRMFRDWGWSGEPGGKPAWMR